MTSNVLIAFGGIALLGIIGFAFVWVASAATRPKEPPSQTGAKSNARPHAH